jgi:hypothetical protein
VAQLMGVIIPDPKLISETQLRELQKELRKKGVRWVREPRWSLLRHDIAVIDFRYALERSLQNLPSYTLENWISDYVFRSDTDVVSYGIVLPDETTVRKKKGVIPDAYFEIVDQNRRTQGENIRARFLLEVDMATHDRNRFCSEKAIPGIAYIKSTAYRQRFGSNNGFWLVVCISERRMKFLRRKVVERTGDEARKFFFTTLDQIKKEDILTSPIWFQSDDKQPRVLLDNR